MYAIAVNKTSYEKHFSPLSNQQAPKIFQGPKTKLYVVQQSSSLQYLYEQKKALQTRHDLKRYQIGIFEILDQDHEPLLQTVSKGLLTKAQHQMQRALVTPTREETIRRLELLEIHNGLELLYMNGTAIEELFSHQELGGIIGYSVTDIGIQEKKDLAQAIKRDYRSDVKIILREQLAIDDFIDAINHPREQLQQTIGHKAFFRISGLEGFPTLKKLPLWLTDVGYNESKSITKRLISNNISNLYSFMRTDDSRIIEIFGRTYISTKINNIVKSNHIGIKNKLMLYFAITDNSSYEILTPLGENLSFRYILDSKSDIKTIKTAIHRDINRLRHKKTALNYSLLQDYVTYFTSLKKNLSSNHEYDEKLFEQKIQGIIDHIQKANILSDVNESLCKKLHYLIILHKQHRLHLNRAEIIGILRLLNLLINLEITH